MRANTALITYLSICPYITCFFLQHIAEPNATTGACCMYDQYMLI
jgi:hypothetical protein